MFDTGDEGTPPATPPETPPTPPTPAADWRDSIPPELRDEPVIKQTKDLGALAKQLVHAERMLGGSLRIPSKEAGKEDWEKFYEKLAAVPGLTRLPDEGDEAGQRALKSKLGVPESPDKYQIPEGIDLGEEVESLRRYAAELGLTQKQFGALAAQEAREIEEANDRLKESQAAAMKELEHQYGSSTKALLDRAASTFRALANGEVQALFDSSGVGNHPEMVKFFAKLGELLDEPTAARLGVSRPSGNIMHPEEAGRQISEIYANREHPYHNRRHPEHQASLDRMAYLFRVKAGEV